MVAIPCLQRHNQRLQVEEKWTAELTRRQGFLSHLAGNVIQVSISIFCTEKTEHANIGLLMYKDNASHYENRTDWTWLACPMPNDEHSSSLLIDTSITLWYVFVDPYESLNTGRILYCQQSTVCGLPTVGTIGLSGLLSSMLFMRTPIHFLSSSLVNICEGTRLIIPDRRKGTA